ncbi:MAG: Trk system potassium transporter TrkA [Acutalibacteraceae bacterium]
MKIVIIGAGKIGKILAKNLRKEGHDICVVDINETRLNRVVDEFDVRGVLGNGTHCDILKEADVKDSYLVIATTMSDEINMLSCMIARKLGARHVIARVRDPEYTNQIYFMREKLGLSMMVNPDMAVSAEIARVLRFPSATNYETFANGRIDMIEIPVKDNNEIAKKSVSEISGMFKGQFIICAVKRGEEVYIPNGSFVIENKDKIYMSASHKTLVSVLREFKILKTKIKNVMIIGGSRIAFYLTAQLTRGGMNVTMVEKDRDRCEVLSRNLPEANIVCGNSNDHGLLLEEGIDKMDAVVTVTDSDEGNFLVAMYAQSFNVKKLVTKINEPEFASLYEKVVGDSSVSMGEVTISMVTKYLRSKINTSGSKMKSLYKLMGGDVEAIEFEVKENSTLAGKKLKELKFKKDTLIVAICRKRKIIFPSGEDALEEKDSVIVVTKCRNIHDLSDVLS